MMVTRRVSEGFPRDEVVPRSRFGLLFSRNTAIALSAAFSFKTRSRKRRSPYHTASGASFSRNRASRLHWIDCGQLTFDAIEQLTFDAIEESAFLHTDSLVCLLAGCALRFLLAGVFLPSTHVSLRLLFGVRDKGKPAARPGRKATGLRPEIARLPNGYFEILDLEPKMRPCFITFL